MAEEQTDIATDAPEAAELAPAEPAVQGVEDHGVEGQPVVEDAEVDGDSPSLPLPEGVELRSTED